MQFNSKHIPIVMLHGVTDSPAHDDLKPWVITEKAYTTLLDYLEREGYTTLVFEDLEKQNFGEKNIIITFDDCIAHLMDFAVPELVKRNMKAVFYMPTAHIGKINEWDYSIGLSKLEIMNEDDLKKLVALGMEVGSHAHRHIMLEEYDASLVYGDIVSSKSILEELTGKQVKTLAYPYGSVPRKYAQMAEDAGYSYALAVYSKNQNNYCLRRWVFHDDDTEKTIRYKMSRVYAIERYFWDKYIYFVKKLKANVYQAIRKLKKVLWKNVLISQGLDMIEEVELLDFSAYLEML